MIEQSIYFALGCIVTALLALLFAPVFWSRALRLTRKRLQLQVPLSMQEILAERDQLRAEFAVERLRVEDERDKALAARDRDRVEIGRRSIEAARVGDEIAALRLLEAAQDREIALLVRDNAEHDAEAGGLRVELHDSHLLVDRMRSLADTATIERSRADTLADRVAVLEASLSDRDETVRAASGLARGDYEAARATIDRLEAEVAESRDRHKTFQLGNSLRVEKEREADRVSADRMDALDAENAGLRRQLSGLRNGAVATLPHDDAGLRRSIHALGLAVADMSRRAGPGDENVGTDPAP